MFIRMFSSFCSIVPCMFEFILMPESSLQEYYMMLTCWNCYNLICHFCHVWCVHPMRLMSTCVLIYDMPSFHRFNPCIFVNCVLSASSLLSRVLVAVFLTDSVIFCCYVNMLLLIILCIIWRCSINMFWSTCHALSIHAPGWIYRLPQIADMLLARLFTPLLSGCLD